MQSIDTLLNARWIIPMEPEDCVLEDHALAVQGGRILEILPRDRAALKYAATTSIDLTSHALIPGLINTHTHAAMALLRGLADDLPLMEWLNQHIWPAEQRWVDADFVRDGTRLAIAEMLRGGITCFNDMYFFPEITAEVARACAMRACIGLIMIDFPSAWAKNAEDYLHKGLALYDTLREDPLIYAAFSPHSPYMVKAASLEKIRRLSEELAIPVHIHVHETVMEVEQHQAKQGCRPLASLAELGLVSSRLIAVHMTQLNDDEIAQIADTGAHVVHCPQSNLKLASGFCPVAKLDAAGVNVALGTDGAASNNDLDLFEEMRVAALLGKTVANDTTALPAHRVLRMATLNGARALGLEQEIGSLRPGKWADMVAVDLGTPETVPVYHPISQLIYATGRHQVSDVWVAGRHLLKERKLTTLDVEDILYRAWAWGEKIKVQQGDGSDDKTKS